METYNPDFKTETRPQDWEVKQAILKNTDLSQGIFEQGYRKGVSDTLQNKHAEISLLKELIYKKDAEIYSLKSSLANTTIVTITRAWLKKLLQTTMKLTQDLRRSIG